MIQLIILLKKLFKTENQFQKIIYYETPLKKKFTKNKNKNLGPSEVNTGYTNLSHPHKNGCITLYRKEEILKVLIHELIHSNHIDYSIINSKFNNLLCSNYDILINESVTETISTIIHVIYIKGDIKKECSYSNYICSKIQNYYEIKNMKIFLKKGGCKSLFYQKTNVLSYYFIKNIFLRNFDDFSKIYIKYSKNYKIIDNIGFIQEIEKLMINHFLFNYEYIDLKKNSLRMCLYECHFC